MNGNDIEVSEEAYKAIASSIQRSPNGLIFLPNGEALNPTSISQIYPKDKKQTSVDRTKQLEGITPDGEHVIKRFGQWYIANPASPYQYDDSGQSILRYEGSPLLPTPEEYETTYKHLSTEAWTSKLIGQSSEVDDRLLIDHANRTTRGGFEKIDSTFVPRISPEDAEL